MAEDSIYVLTSNVEGEGVSRVCGATKDAKVARAWGLAGCESHHVIVDGDIDADGIPAIEY